MGSSTLEAWTDDYDNNLTNPQLEDIASFPYRQVVGSLLYLAVWTRPDLQYAVITVAKHSHRPTLKAIRACKWLYWSISTVLKTEDFNSTKVKIH